VKAIKPHVTEDVVARQAVAKLSTPSSNFSSLADYKKEISII
jgi:hypothetical protein